VSEPLGHTWGISLIPWRAFLKIQGVPSTKFLQGLITQDVETLQQNSALGYGASLDYRGRFLSDFFLYHHEDGWVLECDQRLLSPLYQHLRSHTLRQPIDFTPMGGHVFSTMDSQKAQTFNHAWIDPRTPDLGWRCWQFSCANARQYNLSPSSTYDQRRLQLGIPEGVRDLISSRSFPMDFRMDRWNMFHWAKGCYLGQERTARTRYRSQIKKDTIPARIQGLMPPYGSAIYCQESLAGTVLSHSGSQTLLHTALGFSQGPWSSLPSGMGTQFFPLS